MKLSIGIDVHKEKCAAYAKFAGKGEPRPTHQEFMDGFNEKFRRFSSDSNNSRFGRPEEKCGTESFYETRVIDTFETYANPTKTMGHYEKYGPHIP